MDSKNEIIGEDLICYNIERMSGIELIATDNLIDHLRLVERDKKLCLPSHIVFEGDVSNKEVGQSSSAAAVVLI